MTRPESSSEVMENIPRRYRGGSLLQSRNASNEKPPVLSRLPARLKACGCQWQRKTRRRDKIALTSRGKPLCLCRVSVKETRHIQHHHALRVSDLKVTMAWQGHCSIDGTMSWPPLCHAYSSSDECHDNVLAMSLDIVPWSPGSSAFPESYATCVVFCQQWFCAWDNQIFSAFPVDCSPIPSPKTKSCLLLLYKFGFFLFVSRVCIAHWKKTQSDTRQIPRGLFWKPPNLNKTPNSISHLYNDEENLAQCMRTSANFKRNGLRIFFFWFVRAGLYFLRASLHRSHAQVSDRFLFVMKRTSEKNNYKSASPSCCFSFVQNNLLCNLFFNCFFQ